MAKLFLLAIATSMFALPAEPVRVFISDTQSWTVSGGFGSADGGGGGAVSGGARPQTVEVMNTFRKKCPEVVVTMREETADFIVLLDHEGGKGAIWKDNKIAVFTKAGDMIHSSSTRSLGNAVKDGCEAIKKVLTE